MKIVRWRSRTSIFLHDLLMVLPAWLGAYWLRFNLDTIPENYFDWALRYSPIVVAIQVGSFWVFGLYRGVWRFASLPDFVRIVKAVGAGMLLIACALAFFTRLEGVPRSVPLLYFLNLLLMLAVPRFSYRFWLERASREQRQGLRALIVGAGSAGDMLVRDLLSNAESGFLPVVFVDDYVGKLNREIRGIRVVGRIDQIPEIIERWEIDTILIAVPSANDGQMRRIVEVCETTGVPFQTLPSVKELLSGSVTRANLRDVSIEDILGRDPVRLDWLAIRSHLQDKTLLVTGGGGSIGSELCKQLAKLGPRKLIVLDQCEFNLYSINAYLTQHFPNLAHAAVLADVADEAAISSLLEQQRPDIIFHAAAYKHVPLLEGQVREAVRNNLLGTKTLAEAAIKAGVGRFVLISTDKAVNPTNVMGATKRAAEILCQNLNQQGNTRFMTVRFGNVLDSAGSVVPLFREQIKRGGPVTVTHKDITRYFMTIPEACQLIMQAETVGAGGEIFVLDMGEPIKITYLAEQMIRLSGKRPGQDIEIAFTGLRPGEKLYEELFHEQEQLMDTGFEKLRLAKARIYNAEHWVGAIERLADEAHKTDSTQILSLLQQLVPEFTQQISH